MSLSEPSLQMPPVVVVVVAAVDVEVVELPPELPQLGHRLARPRPEHRLQTRRADAAVAGVVAAVLQFRLFVDQRHSHGFRSCHGRPHSTTTTRPMR
jgi:hypothetical protein